MLVLGVDTATPAVTVAVSDGARVLAERTVVDPRRHGELLAPAVTDALAAAGVAASDLTHVVVGVGPGPYTGLRVGVVTALALADAVGAEVHGLCSLDVLAYAAHKDAESDEPLTVVTDARRREVFWATYQGGERIAGPAVDRPGDAAALAIGRIVGAGAAMYADVFGAVSAPEHPSGAAVCGLAVRRLRDGGELLPARPLYLRRPDTAPPRPAKPVTAR